MQIPGAFHRRVGIKVIQTGEWSLDECRNDAGGERDKLEPASFFASAVRSFLAEEARLSINVIEIC